MYMYLFIYLGPFRGLGARVGVRHGAWQAPAAPQVQGPAPSLELLPPPSPACTAPASGPTLLLSVGTTPPPSTASEFSEFARSPGRLSSTSGLPGTAGVAGEEEREISTGEQREGDRARLSKEGRRNAKQCEMHHPTSLAET